MPVDDLTEQADRFKAGFVVGIGGISYWRLYNPHGPQAHNKQ